MSEIFGNSIMGGGGLTNSKLALADAQPEDVRGGKKFYSGDKQIKTGTLSDVTQATPAITVDAAGKITASATQAAGVVAAGTKSATKQLTVQAGETVTPRISTQTAVASQRFTTGDVKVAAVNGIIRVTYPAGDTCTCKNGNTTLTANASDGITVFLVPNTGTWTLTVTNGTKTATKTVSITATSRFANVTLAYFSATITITYPAASTCVVTDSSGTQVATDTNGDSSAKTWTVIVGATGTYTITATSADGSKTKSTSVTITTDGQSESVAVAYILELYDNGEQYSSVTGGWSLKTSGSSVGGSKFKADHVVIDANYPDSVVLTTNNKIDLSGMRTLIFLAQGFILEGNGTYDGAYVGVSRTQTPFTDENFYVSSDWVSKVKLKENVDYTEYNLDVSALNGSYYVCAVGVAGNSYIASGVNIKSITAR